MRLSIASHHRSAGRANIRFCGRECPREAPAHHHRCDQRADGAISFQTGERIRPLRRRQAAARRRDHPPDEVVLIVSQQAGNEESQRQIALITARKWRQGEATQNSRDRFAAAEEQPGSIGNVDAVGHQRIAQIPTSFDQCGRQAHPYAVTRIGLRSRPAKSLDQFTPEREATSLDTERQRKPAQFQELEIRRNGGAAVIEDDSKIVRNPEVVAAGEMPP